MQGADGVKETDVQLVVKPSQPPAEAPVPAATDQEIADQVATALQREQAAGNLVGYDIDLAVKDGVVVLDGHVADAQQLELALDTTRELSDVSDVVNNLVVSVEVAQNPEPSTAELATDEPRESEENVRNAMYQDDQTVAANQDRDAQDRKIGEELSLALEQAKSQGNLRGFGIGVHVDRGYVWLRGEVSSRE